MRIQHHPACDHLLGAPSDMQDGSCSGLPVAYTEDQYGTWANSFWKPDPEELEALNNGGSIMLQIRAVGKRHPVVGMTVCTDKTEDYSEIEPTK